MRRWESSSNICAVEDCELPVRTRGYCSAHYQRVLSFGSPKASTPIRTRYWSPDESFAAKTRWEGECLIWVGSDNGRGYGKIYFGGRGHMAHRYAWERVNGPIPDGILIDHMCHNSACVNVDHLRLATHSDNSIYQKSVTSESGYKNVYRSKGGYQVLLQHDGEKVLCGWYKDLEVAAEVARRKRREIYGEFAGFDGVGHAEI